MKTSVLKKLGLIDNEIKAYLHLLQSGHSLASDIAKALKLHRTHVYDILDSLEKKSVISYVVRENRKYFEATSPDQLQVLLDLKKQELEEDKKELGSLIAELTSISAVSRTDIKVSVHDGNKGFRAILEDLLRKKSEFYLLGYCFETYQLIKKIFPGFLKRKNKLGIRCKAIIDPALKGSWVEEQKLQEIRFFKYDFPTGIIIYDTRVVLTIIQDTGQVAIVIDNEKISENFKKLFNNIWGTGTK